MYNRQRIFRFTLNHTKFELIKIEIGKLLGAIKTKSAKNILRVNDRLDILLAIFVY